MKTCGGVPGRKDPGDLGDRAAVLVERLSERGLTVEPSQAREIIAQRRLRLSWPSSIHRYSWSIDMRRARRAQLGGCNLTVRGDRHVGVGMITDQQQHRRFTFPRRPHAVR